MPISARFEHIALNVPDPAATAQWYCDHLKMKVALSGPAPVSVRFVSDEAGHMMFEFYHNTDAPVLDYATIAPLSLHVALAADDLEAVRDELLAAGATLTQDVTVADSGDMFVMLRDPWDLPLQFVKRKHPML